MKKLELENYDVLEMSNSEMILEQGGIIWCIIAGFAIAALILDLIQ
jgi:hypothetical protein